ncbi:MAG: 50S ribosomal protein L4 [Rhodospirillales bacterium]
MKADVISLDNKKVGDVELDDAVFGLEVRADLLARYVNWQLANRRQGTHSVKGRSDVSGRKGKAFRQKGTGRARQGTHRAPQHRGGGIVHGPTPRSHGFDLPKRVRRLALKTALSAKAKDGQLVILEGTALKNAKTSALAKHVAALGWTSALVIDGDAVDKTFIRAAGNLPGIDAMPQIGANVHDILRHETLVLTTAAAAKLSERLK